MTQTTLARFSPPEGHRDAPAFSPACCLPARAGVGLKPQHFPAIIGTWPAIGFFEIHAENYLVPGGPFHHYLRQIRDHYPLSVHGVGLSIGAEDPLDRDHLHAVRDLVDRYEPAVFSEHLAWRTHGGHFFNDLLPLPYDAPTLSRVCDHIDQVQEILRRPILLENPATYVEFSQSSYSEAAFITEVVRRTGCGLLLDVNNAYISATNHNRDVEVFLFSLPLPAVGEIHLAGHSRQTDAAGAPLLIDTHGCAIDKEVWRLYGRVLERIGATPTLIEWDNDVPDFQTLSTEAHCAELYLMGHEIVRGALE